MVTLERSFCTCESERKINYSQVLAVSAFYVGELCRLNYVGELCESRRMKDGVELSAKPKHNIKSFSKFKESPSLEVTRVDE